MNYFEEKASEAQKLKFEELLKSYTTFGLLDTKAEKERMRTEVFNLREYAGMVPEHFVLRDYPVTYDVTSVELIKINGVDNYKITLRSRTIRPAYESIVVDPIVIKVIINAELKEKYIGNCKEVILDSTVQGMMGPCTNYKRLSYTECAPNVFQDKFTLHTASELRAGYLDTIVKEAEIIYLGHFDSKDE